MTSLPRKPAVLDRWDGPWTLPPTRWSPRLRRSILGAFGAWLAGFAVLVFAEILLTRPELRIGDPTLAVGGLLIATFLAAAPTGRRGSIAPLDLLLSGSVIISLIYRSDALPRLLGAGAMPTSSDLLAASVLGFAVLEAGRRMAGWPAAVGALLWAVLLVVRPASPAILSGEPIDGSWLLMNLFVTPNGPFGGPFEIVITIFFPAMIFAGALLASGASNALAAAMARIPNCEGVASGLARLALTPLALPSGDEERRLNHNSFGLGALAPLVPPVIGSGALIAAAMAGQSYGDTAKALALPAFLAVLLAIPSVWTKTSVRVPEMSALDVVLAPGPIVVVVLLFAGVSPLTSFLIGAGLLALGAAIRSPGLATLWRFVQGAVWASRITAGAGGLAVFLGLVGALEGLSGLFSTTAGIFAQIPAPLLPVFWSALGLIFGAALVPAGAAVALGWLSQTMMEPGPAWVAALFWAAAGAAIVNVRQSMMIGERLVRASPILLTAIVLTRIAFGYERPTLIPFDVLAVFAIAWGFAGPRRIPVFSRILLVVGGIFLFLPRPELAVLAVVIIVAAIVPVIRRTAPSASAGEVDQ